ncbi:ALPHA/BETA FOLD HYDROLASE [Salix koriyanagi]|uniref:ALPHA/BETA FOLD HYDROLASE n=1 Tax=Salix koriyanagi TaxID=2511006 RepID=A0A9Q0T580_9ROSI|nr:ALPHA/BETA FOLD HYDROLASE [Salix koriyanagi]
MAIEPPADQIISFFWREEEGYGAGGQRIFGGDGGGEGEEVCTDGDFYGGDGGVAVGIIDSDTLLKGSFTDIPIISLIRSFLIICVYSMCDAPARSHGPYLGTVTLCSVVSVMLLSIKTFVFTVNSPIEAEASISSISRQKLHLKKSWGMPVLFLSSVVFALGHTVVAYRTSCRARRKLMFHRVDPEAVLSWELPVRLLADIDSLFTTCLGLTVHYKLCFPGAPPRYLSSTAVLESSSCGSSPKLVVGRLRLERQPFSAVAKTQHHLRRSYSNQFYSSSLYAPLLDGSPNSALSEEIPVLNLDDALQEDGMGELNSVIPKLDMEEKGQLVAAFDRPGWGLTSRLCRKDWEDKELPNPYKLETQVDLLLSFCSEMGFSSVVLVGHDDGGLLALKATQRVQESMTSFNVTIKGVVLLNVSLSREVVPAFARILMRTSLGKKHLVRPLLQTEIIQVVNRRAWYDATKLTAEILSLYKAQLCVEGWDEAVHEIGKLSCETVLSPQHSAALLKAVAGMPVLVIAGAEDVLVPLKSSQAMASKLVNSRLVAISGCGHLPHEECPKALLAAISPFISRLLLESDLEKH